ncbi:MAG: CopD family protein [Chlamydiales bacterium]
MVNYLKALHIIFVVTWFAGLFYIVRLFIYHVEASTKAEPEKSILINHFKGAQKRLWYGITWPSMILTYLFGFWMAFEMFGFQFPTWLWTKLAFVLGLTAYHFYCQRMLNNLKKDNIVYSSFGLRIWNEVTTIFLFVIVFIVVLHRTITLTGLAAIVALIALLLFGIIQYKRRRK